MKMVWMAVVLLLGSNLAQATTISFSNWQQEGSSPIVYDLTVDDDTTGLFTINVSIAASSSNVGDIFGVGFDLDYTVASSDIIGGDITGKNSDTNKVGGNNLSPLTPFNWLVTIGNSGSSGEFFTSTMFTVADLGETLDLATFTRFGVRAQTVGAPPAGGDSSSKDWTATSTVVTTPPPSPVPESGTLLGSGLLGLAVYRKKSRKS